jgi:hypothetical protein
MDAGGCFESAVQDVRYAVRCLLRAPSFTAVALFTLALGIAATTAIFGTVNATLLRPLPYLRANELVDVRTRLDAADIAEGHHDGGRPKAHIVGGGVQRVVGSAADRSRVTA